MKTKLQREPHITGNSARQTRARKQKRNRTKYHKSAPKDRGKHSRSRQPIDFEFLTEKQLTPAMVPHAKALFLEARERTGYIAKACEAAGIGRKTYYDWIMSDVEFRKAAKRAHRVFMYAAIDDVETAFSQNAQYKDTLAGIFLLKHNRKRYREVSRIQLSGPDGGPIMTLDAKEELIRRLEKIMEREGAKPVIAGGVEVRSLTAGSAGPGGPQGLTVVKSEGSAGSKVRKARGVRYG